MKKALKKLSCIATACVCAVPVLAFSACGESETKYHIVGTDKTYHYYAISDSTVEVDDGIVIDGKLDEPFYTRKVQNWYRANRRAGDPNKEGSFTNIDLAVTTYFTSNAVLIGIDVTGDWSVSYQQTRITTRNSGVEFYVTANAPDVAEGNLFEMDLCAGGEQLIKCLKDGRFQGALLSADRFPKFGIALKGGEINTPECTGYTMEWYIPYTMFGLEEAPEQIDINPAVISMATVTGETREWYLFGQQSPNICGWVKPTAYPFDSRGFICNRINIEAEGGEVMQERGYDWCVTGDEVTFYLEPDNPSAKLTTFKVNGVEMKDKVRNDEIKVKCEGDMNIVAQFA